MEVVCLESIAYEDDDYKVWASLILVGDTFQAHNFHDASDVDWISFTSLENESYVIEVFDVGSATDPVSRYTP